MSADIQLNLQSITTTSATTAPSSGTSETWTVTALSSGIPALATGQTYSLVDATSGATGTQQAEVVRITACAGSGATSVTVTRGADGTTPVAHASTSTFNIVVVESYLNQTKMGPPPVWAGDPKKLLNYYDSRKCVYNWKGSNTRRLRRELNGAAKGGMTYWATIGDSASAGCNSSNVTTLFDRSNAWPLAMRNSLAGMGIPMGGTGLMRLADGSFTDTQRYSYTGTWTNGSSYLRSTVNSSSFTCTPDVGGTVLEIGYALVPNGGTFTVSVNGAASGAGFLSVSTANASTSWVNARMTGLKIIAGVTKIVVTVTSAGVGGCYLRGLNVFTPNGGLIMHNLAQSGATAAGSGVGSWSDSATTAIMYNMISAPGTSRQVTDAVFTSASATMTSSTAAFTANDIGSPVDCIVTSSGILIPENTVIVGFNSPTSVTLSNVAYASGSAQTVVIGRTPSVIFLEIGGNDITAGTSMSTISTAIQTVRANWPNADVILCLPQEFNYSVTNASQANQDAFAAMMYQLADALDVPLFDWRDRLGRYSEALARNVYGDINVHLQPSVYAMLGAQMAELIGESAGKTQTFQNPTTDFDAAPKVYVDNLTKTARCAATNVLTTTETVVMSIFVPANTFQAGSSMDFNLFMKPGTSTITTTRVRIGATGTTSDAAVAAIAATASASLTARYVEGVVSVQGTGAAATFIGGGVETVGAISAAGSQSTSSGTFDTTKDNYITITVQNTTSGTTVVSSGRAEFSY